MAYNYNSSANYNDSTCEYDTNSAYNVIWLINHKYNTNSFSYLIDYQDDSGTLIQFTIAAIYAGKLIIVTMVQIVSPIIDMYLSTI